LLIISVKNETAISSKAHPRDVKNRFFSQIAVFVTQIRSAGILLHKEYGFDAKKEGGGVNGRWRKRGKSGAPSGPSALRKAGRVPVPPPRGRNAKSPDREVGAVAI